MPAITLILDMNSSPLVMAGFDTERTTAGDGHRVVVI
jgi:hypothetical protein